MCPLTPFKCTTLVVPFRATPRPLPLTCPFEFMVAKVSVLTLLIAVPGLLPAELHGVIAGDQATTVGIGQ